VSPVPIGNEDDDDDGDDEDANRIAPYHRALQQASFVGMAASNSSAHEQTTLLGRKIVKPSMSARQDHQVATALRSGYPVMTLEETVIHRKNGTPYLYNTQHFDNNDKPQTHEKLGLFQRLCQHRSSCHWFIPASTALFLALIGLHDVFLKYISWRRGVETNYSLTWSLPWLGPSARSLLRFGAFCPSTVFEGLYDDVEPRHLAMGEYWRILTGGIWVTSSLMEWGFLYLAWCWAIPPCDRRRLHKLAAITPVSAAQDPYWNNPYDWNRLSQPVRNTTIATTNETPWQLSWPVVYIVSTLTGQLWMTAFEYRDNNALEEYNAGGSTSGMATISGCTSWGTAGVLCAKGMQHPDKRFELFCLAIALVLLNLLQSTASVFGAIGSAFFGWTFAGMWSMATFSTKKKSSGATTWQNQFLTDSPAARNYHGWSVWGGLSTIVAVALWIGSIVYVVRRS
jgi:hypothetical protein